MFKNDGAVCCWSCLLVCSGRFRHVDYPMIADIDVGIAFLFFWSFFVFIAFVIVISLLTAIYEHFIKDYEDDDKENDDG